MPRDDQAPFEPSHFEERQAGAENVSDRERAEFLASISHEIRTPLNAIMGYAEMLSKTNLDAKQQHFTANIVKSSLTLVDILNTWLQQNKSVQPGQVAQAAPLLPAAVNPAPGRDNGPCKLLVVEDSSMIRDLFMDIFSEDHLSILTASNGAKALELAFAELPQLIFLDLHLPDSDGWQVAKSLRRNVKTAAIPLVAMTGQLLKADEYKPYFDDFLQKPFQLKQLRALVDSWLDRSANPAAPDLSAVQGPEPNPSDHCSDTLAESVLPCWNLQFSKLLVAINHTGSLNIAIELGRLMENAGQEQNCSALEQAGQRLASCASLPDIAGVEVIIKQLHPLLKGTES